MTITLAQGANTISIDPPQYGYSVDLNMALSIKETADGKLAIYDSGSSYDYRILSIEFMLNRTQQISLLGFLNNQLYARGKDITMPLGTSPTGFYPAGPDKGDVGTFGLHLIDFEDTTYLYNPYRYFRTKAIFKIVSMPAYSLPSRTGYGEGDFSIKAGGQTAIGNLRFPQEGIQFKFLPGIDEKLTQSGVPYSVDCGNNADGYESSFTIVGNQPNMAAVIDELCTDIRGAEFLINSDDDILPFGVLKNGYDCYAKLIDYKLKITHVSETEFAVGLRTRLNSVVAQ